MVDVQKAHDKKAVEARWATFTPKIISDAIHHIAEVAWGLGTYFNEAYDRHWDEDGAQLMQGVVALVEEHAAMVQTNQRPALAEIWKKLAKALKPIYSQVAKKEGWNKELRDEVTKIALKVPESFFVDGERNIKLLMPSFKKITEPKVSKNNKKSGEGPARAADECAAKFLGLSKSSWSNAQKQWKKEGGPYGLGADFRSSAAFAFGRFRLDKTEQSKIWEHQFKAQYPDASERIAMLQQLMDSARREAKSSSRL